MTDDVAARLSHGIELVRQGHIPQAIDVLEGVHAELGARVVVLPRTATAGSPHSVTGLSIEFPASE